MTAQRKLIQIFEIDVPYCDNTFGVAPCTATADVGKECYNCWSTCADRENFAEIQKTVRFTNADTGIPKGSTYFPAIQGSVSTRPTSINVGGQNEKEGALGRRATVKVKLNDFPYHDRLLDKYVDTRLYDPLETGTFWRKFKARWPYYEGYPVRVRDGEQNTPINDLRTRHYVLTKIDGPGDNSAVSITAKDVLALADNKRALAPKLSEAVLASPIGTGGGVVFINPANSLNDIPASGKAKVGSEAVTYTLGPPGSVIITGRGIDGTEAVAHEAGDAFQPAYSVSSKRIDEVVKELLADYAGTDPAFWDPQNEIEADTWMQSFVLTADIYEPTGVNELLAEISRVGVIIWWDEVAQYIRMRTIRAGVGDEIKLVNDRDHTLADSISFADYPDEQVSQVWTYYGQIDPFGSVDDGRNYARINVRRDAQVEEDSGSTVIKRQYSRFLTSQNEGAIIANSLRILNRYVAVPIRGTIELDVADRGRIWTGDVLRVNTELLTSPSGEPQERLFQVISAEDADPGHRVKYTIQSMEPPGKVVGRPGYVVPDATPTYDLATPAERDPKGGFAVDGTVLQFSDNTQPYQII